jgi:hypothetical protein
VAAFGIHTQWRKQQRGPPGSGFPQFDTFVNSYVILQHPGAALQWVHAINGRGPIDSRMEVSEPSKRL